MKKTALVVFIICAIGVLVCAIMLTKDLNEKNKAKEAYESLRAEVWTETLTADATANADAAVNLGTEELSAAKPDFSELQLINEDIIGWISSDGAIDYPILQTGDNEFYLTHIYDKSYSVSGSVFMDCRNSGDFSDRNTVLYGHNMKNGTMFHELSNYKTQEYFDEHKTMTIATTNGSFELELISGTIEDGNHEFVRLYFTDDEDFLSYVDSLRERSLFESDADISADDRLVSLCTCTYERTNARYMVVGRLSE